MKRGKRKKEKLKEMNRIENEMKEKSQLFFFM